jgi:hypothetical protein
MSRECTGRLPQAGARLICLGIAILGCVAACSEQLELMLFNNSSGPIQVHLRERNIAIGAGSSARFKYPPTREEWALRLSASGCELTYLPPHYPEYPFRPGSYNNIKAQIEPDLSIHLVTPRTVSVSDVSLSASLQTRGFPLRPSSRACPS